MRVVQEATTKNNFTVKLNYWRNIGKPTESVTRTKKI